MEEAISALLHTLLVGLLALFSTTVTYVEPATAHAAPLAVEAPQATSTRQVVEIPVAVGTSTVESLIAEYATLYNLDYGAFRGVAKCESHLNPKAVGDHGKSFGLWQIYLPAHPTITRAQALDPDFATRWAAQQWAKGDAHLWTCARLLGVVPTPFAAKQI